MSISIVGAPDRWNLLASQQQHLNVIQTMCTCITDSFCTSVEFYAVFMCYQLYICVLLATIFLLLESAGYISFYLVFLVIRLAEMMIIPVFLCQAIRNEFLAINALFDKFYYKKGISLLKSHLDKCVRQFQDSSMVFDCDFFEVDVELFAVVFDFVSPVSYTHLDVYKRQVLHCTSIAA